MNTEDQKANGEDALKTPNKSPAPRKVKAKATPSSGGQTDWEDRNGDDPPGGQGPEHGFTDAASQKDVFQALRREEAQIPRRFWKKTIKDFRVRSTLGHNLVGLAKSFVTSFDFEKEYPKGLLMIGGVGSGKSHLAVAILCEVIAKGYSGLYYNSPDLLRDIRATFDSEGDVTEDAILDKITEVDLLVLDDLGAEKVSEFVLDRLYIVVNKRYEGCKPMIVTTNLEVEELEARLNKRIVSRFFEMCAIFGPFPEHDYRRRIMDGQDKEV